jgi:sulfite reductase (ferredoxin)
MTTNGKGEASEPRQWKAELESLLGDKLSREIESFEGQIEQKRAGKLTDEVFAEMRLRRGVYGQRYDNGQRHDGLNTRELVFPNAGLTKGPGTQWDAPGMVRIKNPFGAITADQMDVLAEVGEEYADSILHVTTRQDIQLHFVHLEETPDLMRRLGAVGITTHEACGNAVRNVTACHLSGVCTTQTFDVTPYAAAVSDFLLGHPDAQEFGRKVKPAFSGCADRPCGLVKMHDIGGIARVREVDGKEQRGFEFYVGGGLGAVPHQAKLFEEFLPEEELLPTCQAISRVFARLGEKTVRSRARLKFLVAKLGIEEFRRLVLEDRAGLSEDPRWTAFLADVDKGHDAPLWQIEETNKPTPSPQSEAWLASNVTAQRQPGYKVVMVYLPLGDITSDQMRGLADIARRFTGDSVRMTVEQNLALRWVRESDLPALHEALDGLGLAVPQAETLTDITACPGTDTCKLGISSSRGLARTLMDHFFDERNEELEEVVRGLRIKISGCFNSCGQHHMADIGFWGVSRKRNGYNVPHFQVVLGGQWAENAGSYGLAIVAVPARNIPTATDRIVQYYVDERQGDESFQAFVTRVGKASLRTLLEDLVEVPTYEQDRSFYSNWGDPREFTLGDMGIGECAGQVVSPVEFGLQASEREIFEAQDRLDQGDASGAADIAYRAMLIAARTLAREKEAGLGENPEDVVAAFKAHLFDSGLFHDPYAGGKFGSYLFRVHGESSNGFEATPERARQRIEEAQLFVEAAHSYHVRTAEAVLG